MRQVVGRALWLGHVGDTRQPRPLLDAGIAAVVELADSEPLAVLPRELVRCRFPLTDGGGNPAWLVRLAAEAVAALLRARVPTLVCCGCGLSRSVCIAAAGVALAEGRSLNAALAEVVGTGPADVSPGLLAEVQTALAALAPKLVHLPDKLAGVVHHPGCENTINSLKSDSPARTRASPAP